MHCFVGLRDGHEHTHLYDGPGGKTVREVLWGDWLNLDPDQSGVAAGWTRVIWGPQSDDPQKLYIPASDTSDTRPLEIIFVDVGQGDGAVLISPEREPDEERVLVIDAGEGSEMSTFLAGRFGGYNNQMTFHAAVITHPDQDHYKGFEAIFNNPDFRFERVYQNGLVERPAGTGFDKIGGLMTAPDGRQYVAELADTDESIRTLFGNPASFGRTAFPPVMHAAIANGVSEFAMLATPKALAAGQRTYMPGFSPADALGYTIEVLGPVTEVIGGKTRLRKLGGYGPTKNAHSVILRLEYGQYRVLLGGDLNAEAEKFLLTHYSGLGTFPRKRANEEAEPGPYTRMMADASNRFRCEIMKVCHHGARDVTDEFIRAVDPAGFVISSGDTEGHVHPRPDLLGRLGRNGRGESPVLLSTELQRSTRVREDDKAVEKLKKSIESYRSSAAKAEKTPGSAAAQQAMETAKKAMEDEIAYLARENVDVYGAIYLKTDGKRLITAFRIEQPSLKKTWFWFEYRYKDGALELVS